jgi:hypothetical protein
MSVFCNFGRQCPWSRANASRRPCIGLIVSNSPVRLGSLALPRHAWDVTVGIKLDTLSALFAEKWVSGVSLQGSNPELLMSALGQKRTFGQLEAMSALPPKADINQSRRHVR